MTTRARVGIFTLLALAGVFATYYFITNFALRHTGYQIGVHFRDVGGLQEGSTVLLSGVQIGEVTSVQLLEDQTVDVICTINPGNVIYRDSTFVVAITITGATTLVITPPKVKTVAEVLPQQPLPIAQQPWGTLPPTLTDLVSAGQEQLKNFSKTMNVVNRELPALARRFSSIAGHADTLVLHADSTLLGLSGQLQTTVALLNETIGTSGRNVDQLTGNMNQLIGENRQRFNALIDNLAKTSDNLNKTMAGVASIAQDPLLHQSLVGTVQNVQAATAKLKAIATELESVTGDPKTQSELRGTISNLQGVTDKANAILGTFVTSEQNEQNASPQPAASGSPGPAPSPRARAVRRGLFSQPLVQAQVRETWSNRGGGPASDLNVVLLPSAPTHVTIGSNDLGYNTTYNLLVNKNASPNLQVGAGVLYSKLGLAALFRPFGSPLGIDARLYDPRHPTLDLYGDIRLTERLDLFYGERSLWSPTTRGTNSGVPSFGIQVKY